MNLRAAAARIIYQVIHDGQSLSDCLPEMIKKFRDSRDQAFLQAVCFGVCRWYFFLDSIAQLLLTKALKEKDQDIYCLLLVGLYQLNYMRVPAHAAVAETVAAADDFKKMWAKNLINAVLRNYQRRKDELHDKIKNNKEAFYSHPKWIIGRLKKDWPEQWENILNENNLHPPFSLRINQKRLTREDYLAKLVASFADGQQDTLLATPIVETGFGIILGQAVDVQQLPGFANGEISVQDGAAQLAASLLELSSGQKVLDACAAPGGKTAHMLESQADIEVTAVDYDKKRVSSIHDNLKRLQLTADCQCADVADVARWWDGKCYDRILLDAPCSASGVIRRHPDIKLLRRAEDVAKLEQEQMRLLQAVWELLKPGGLLVYATCSVFKDENTDILQAFLAKHPDAIEEKIVSSWGIDCTVGKQILPGMHGMDGFYYGRLRKNFFKE